MVSSTTIMEHSRPSHYQVGNGTFVLSNYNNDFTSWVDAGTVVPEQPEEFTTLDNSYFKDSNSQAITIATRGTIPYFTSNSTFGKLDLPGKRQVLAEHGQRW